MHSSALVPLALSVSLVFAGCGDDGTVADASTDSSTDSSSGDSARPDGATDSGEDSASPDAGDTGTPALTPASRVTALVAGTVITFPVVDEAGAPLLLGASASFDHDATAGQSVIASDGTSQRVSTSFVGPAVTFGPATPWVDEGGAALAPDVLFAGALGTGAPVLMGTFGTDARGYDFVAQEFGAVFPLVQMGGAPFTPISATTVNVTGTGAAIVALSAASPEIFVFNTTTAQFDPIPTAPVTCSAGTAIYADHVLGALLVGFTPPGGVDSVILIDGSDAFLLEDLDPFCFTDAYPLVDASGVSLTPEEAFGWDYDGDGDDDIIMVDTVMVPVP
ncbi:MAG: hypothetical protein DRJ42_01195 [Deltaproteobacteria bacterium]|nr:MAG: hypothetical protein DRJ42_01195 [Deltaproteobacteria bacterium]